MFALLLAFETYPYSTNAKPISPVQNRMGVFNAYGLTSHHLTIFSNTILRGEIRLPFVEIAGFRFLVILILISKIYSFFLGLSKQEYTYRSLSLHLRYMQSNYMQIK